MKTLLFLWFFTGIMLSGCCWWGWGPHHPHEDHDDWHHHDDHFRYQH